MLSKYTILITGGTGSFGNTFVPMTMAKHNPKELIVYSCDEMKQWEMAKKYADDRRVRFFIGDVRDRKRLYRALDGADVVVHAAATKIVPMAEYNPFECVKTCVIGAMNLIDACIQITRGSVRSVRPGYGTHPRFLPQVIGRRLKVNVSAATPVSWTDID